MRPSENRGPRARSQQPAERRVAGTAAPGAGTGGRLSGVVPVARARDSSAGPCSPSAPLSQNVPVPPRPPLRQGRICGSGPGQRPPRQLDCAPDWVRGVPGLGAGSAGCEDHSARDEDSQTPRAILGGTDLRSGGTGERGRGTGERGRGERSASEEVTGSPSPESPAVLGPAPGLCSAVGCSLDVTYLGRKRDFSPQSSGVAAPVELMQGLLRTVRTVPERWAGRGQSGRLVWLAAVLAAGSGPGSLRAGKSSRRQGGIGGM